MTMELSGVEKRRETSRSRPGVGTVGLARFLSMGSVRLSGGTVPIG